MEEYRLKIEESFKALLSFLEKRENDDKDRIITNIYKAGRSFEHWFQLELFSQLCNEFSDDKYEVKIEAGKYRFDIGVYGNKGIKEIKEIKVALELKVVANWSCSDSQMNGILSDIDKLNKYQESKSAKLALVLSQFGIPKDDCPAWLIQQIKAENSTRDEQIYHSRINVLLNNSKIEEHQRLGKFPFKVNCFKELYWSGVLISVK